MWHKLSSKYPRLDHLGAFCKTAGSDKLEQKNKPVAKMSSHGNCDLYSRDDLETFIISSDSEF